MIEENEQVIQQFFRDYNQRFRPETIRSYGIALHQFYTYCPKTYDQVKKQDVFDWVSHLGVSQQEPNTVRLKLASLKSFYRYLSEENLISRNVTQGVIGPELQEKPLKYLDKRTLAKLLELTLHCAKDRAIMEVLYATGVRASELLNIKDSDINWDQRYIWIREGKGNKERFVLFTQRCAERVQYYLRQRGFESAYLFSKPNGRPYSRTWLDRLFHKYSNELNYNHKITPHVLRHTFAAHLAEKGMKEAYIQDLLGHKQLRNTYIYTRLSNEARKKQYDRYQ